MIDYAGGGPSDGSDGGPGDGGPGGIGAGSVSTGISGSSSTPPTPPVRTGRNKSLIRRDPTVDRREGRNWEILVQILNSLMLGGYIYQLRTGVWAIQVTGTNGPTGVFTDTF